MVWILREPQAVVGAIRVKDCVFTNCRFYAIAFVAPDSDAELLISKLRNAMRGGDST
jgi:hypothetical protein